MTFLLNKFKALLRVTNGLLLVNLPIVERSGLLVKFICLCTSVCSILFVAKNKKYIIVAMIIYCRV